MLAWRTNKAFSGVRLVEEQRVFSPAPQPAERLEQAKWLLTVGT